MIQWFGIMKQVKIFQRKITKMKNRNKPGETKFDYNKKLLSIGIFLGVVLIYIFSKNIDNSYGIGIINDEFGYWGIAARWAGKDWSDLLADTPYYSFGYSMVVTAFFHLINDSEIIYRIALWLNIAFILGCYILTYFCGKKIFPQNSSIIMLMISFAVTVYTNNIVQAQVAWTETILYFLYWLLLFFVIRIINKSTYKDVMIYALLNVFIYYVHQRALGVAISSILIMIILVFCKKISKGQLLVFFIVFVIFFGIGMWQKRDILATVFIGKENLGMNDYSGETAKAKMAFTSFEGIMLLIESVLGKAFYLGAATFSIGFLSILWILKKTISGGIAAVKSKFSYVDNIFFVALYLLMSYGATFLIAAISVYRPEGRLDLLLYGRYMEFAIGPLLMLGLLLLVNRKIDIRQIISCTVVLFLLAMFVNKVYVSLDAEDYNGMCISVLWYFFSNMKQVNGLPCWIAVYSTTVVLIMWFIINLEGKKSAIKRNAIAIILISICWINLSDYSEIEGLQKSVKQEIGEIVEKINDINGEYSICMIEDVENMEADHYAKYLQYYLPNKTIRMIGYENIFEEEEENSTIYIMYSDDDLLWTMSEQAIILDRSKSLMVFTIKDNVKLIDEWSNQ